MIALIFVALAFSVCALAIAIASFLGQDHVTKRLDALLIADVKVLPLDNLVTLKDGLHDALSRK